MDQPIRKSPRLIRYDYSQDNYYFVTVCTNKKKCLFGTPCKLNWMGQIVQKNIEGIPTHFSSVKIDKYVVMPNHIHMIVVLGCQGNTENKVRLDTVIGLLKSGITKQIRLKNPKIDIWQRSFHDHIIRNQLEYEKIWAYIDTNPQLWDKDCFFAQFPETAEFCAEDGKP